MRLRVLDLFSGGGMFSLGLERAGMQTVAFCEIEEYPRRVLAARWPGVPIYDDVRTLTAERLAADGIAVDVVTGGFPCQDISNAGKRAGIDGERSGLWSEMARLVGELRPKAVVIENSGALVVRGLDRVLRDLADHGYDAEWHRVRASDLGADHDRARVVVIAYPAGVGQSQPWFSWADACNSQAREPWEATDAVHALRRGALSVVCREHHGHAHRMDRLKLVGNAVVPAIPELIGHAILRSAA